MKVSLNYHFFNEVDGMPIITLGTTEPEGIIVETGTLPDDFYTTLQGRDVEMLEPVDFETKASLIAKYMRDSDDEAEQPVVKAQNKNKQNKHSNKNKVGKKNDTVKNSRKEALKARSELEFSARNDGSVNCRLCGKIFATRQHWYRHKYRAHVVDPVPLNKCEKCLIFFKSRKGYLGHMSSKHNEKVQDATLLRNEQSASAQDTTALRSSVSTQTKVSDPEMAIPKTILQNYQSHPCTSAQALPRSTSRTKNVDKKKANQSAAKAAEEIDPKEYQERRVKDESFVLGIIEKVRRQCATEPGEASRRGYSRKPYHVRTYKGLH